MQKERINFRKELLIEKKELLKGKMQSSYLYLKKHKLYFKLLKDYCLFYDLNPYMPSSAKQFDTFLDKYLNKNRRKLDQIRKLYEANGCQGEISTIIDQYLIENELLLLPNKYSQMSLELELSIFFGEELGLEEYCQLMEKCGRKKEEESNYQPIKRK